MPVGLLRAWIDTLSLSPQETAIAAHILREAGFGQALIDMGEAGDAARTHHSAYHVLRRQDISDAELHTLHQLARLDLHADGRPLLRHVTEWSAWHEAAFNARDLPVWEKTFNFPSVRLASKA